MPHATTIPSTALAPIVPVFTSTERLALAGYLAGYSGLPRQACELDLRQFASWCQQHQLRLFSAQRADIEFFARDLEARGRARPTITGRLCTVAGFHRYAVEEELLDHSPAAHVRRPRLDYESHALSIRLAGLRPGGPPPETPSMTPETAREPPLRAANAFRGSPIESHRSGHSARGVIRMWLIFDGDLNTDPSVDRQRVRIQVPLMLICGR